MTREARKEKREGEGRAKRVGLGLQRNSKLEAYTPQGYVGRWINDTGNRISSALNGGWVFMQDKKPVGSGVQNLDSDLGKYTSQVVGKKEDGSPLRAYWMLLKKEWYEEDQREKQKPVDEIEQAIKRGKYQPSEASTEGQYVPKTGIKIE